MGVMELPYYRDKNSYGSNIQNHHPLGITSLYEDKAPKHSIGPVMSITPASSIGSIVCQYYSSNQLRAISPSVSYSDQSGIISESDKSSPLTDAFFAHYIILSLRLVLECF